MKLCITKLEQFLSWRVYVSIEFLFQKSLRAWQSSVERSGRFFQPTNRLVRNSFKKTYYFLFIILRFSLFFDAFFYLFLQSVLYNIFLLLNNCRGSNFGSSQPSSTGSGSSFRPPGSFRSSVYLVSGEKNHFICF